MKTIKPLLSLLAIFVVTLSYAQPDRFVMGEDLLTVQSSSINKKLPRVTFSSKDDLYIKAVLPQSVESTINKYDGNTLAIQIISGAAKSYNLIYPELRNEHLDANEITLALCHSSKLTRDVINVEKDFLNICRKAQQNPTELEIAIVVTDKNKQVLHTITSRNITIK